MIGFLSPLRFFQMFTNWVFFACFKIRKIMAFTGRLSMRQKIFTVCIENFMRTHSMPYMFWQFSKVISLLAELAKTHSFNACSACVNIFFSPLRMR
jgi:hypothetical protein